MNESTKKCSVCGRHWFHWADRVMCEAMCKPEPTPAPADND